MKSGNGQTGLMENYLKKVKPPSNSAIDIYYLKIITVDPGSTNKFEDLLLKVQFGESENTLKIVGSEKYNFRSSEGLQTAFKKIKSGIFVKKKFYLISCGHGNGFSTYRRYIADFSPTPFFTDEKTITGDDYIEIISTPSDIDKKWETETLWNIELSKACKILKPEVGIFNNCYVNFFDSLYFYSDSFKYIVASERYLCSVMLRLHELIMGIIEASSLPPEQRALKIYATALGGVADGVSTSNCDSPSLVLVEMEHLPALYNELNRLFEYISDKFGSDIKWFEDLRSATDDCYLINNYWLIEFFTLLSELGKELKDSTVSEKIESIQNIITKQIVLRYQSFGSANKGSSGISIYLPKKNNAQFHLNKFLEYKENMKKLRGNLSELFKWYVLLDKMEKMVQPVNA